MIQSMNKYHTQFNLTFLWEDQSVSLNFISIAIKLKSLQSEEKYCQSKKRDNISLQKLSRKLMKNSLRMLTFSTIINLKVSINKTVDIRKESSWNIFNKVYNCELMRLITVIESHCQSFKIFVIRKFSKDIRENIIQVFNRVQHDNIISILKCFLTSNCLYIIFEHQSAILNYLIICRKWFSDIQLISIMI